MDKTSLGDRMKEYENASRFYLPKRLPVIIRCDGRAFHTLTHNFDRPFDVVFHTAMIETARKLCESIMGAKIAYTQSDEISILLTNNDNINTQPWFDNNLQKIVSIAAASATAYFNEFFNWYSVSPSSCPYKLNKPATFDARAFVLPEDEVVNYFIFRQQNATRNSIQMAARAMFTHKECDHKNCNDLQEMLWQKGINWNDYKVWEKRGSAIIKVKQEENDVMRHRWVEDTETPIFTEDRMYIENLLKGDKSYTSNDA